MEWSYLPTCQLKWTNTTHKQYSCTGGLQYLAHSFWLLCNASKKTPDDTSLKVMGLVTTASAACGSVLLEHPLWRPGPKEFALVYHEYWMVLTQDRQKSSRTITPFCCVFSRHTKPRRAFFLYIEEFVEAKSDIKRDGFCQMELPECLSICLAGQQPPFHTSSPWIHRRKPERRMISFKVMALGSFKASREFKHQKEGTWK